MSTFLGIAYVVTVIGFVLWLHARPNPAQVISEYKALQRQIESEERSLKLAIQEGWPIETAASVRDRLARLRAQLAALESA